MKGKIVKTTLLSFVALLCMLFVVSLNTYASSFKLFLKDSLDDTKDYGTILVDDSSYEIKDATSGDVYDDAHPFNVTKVGYVFDGFYTAKTGGVQCIDETSMPVWGLYSVSDGDTIYARFVPGIYEISLKINDDDPSWTASMGEKNEYMYEKYGDGFYNNKTCLPSEKITKLVGTTRDWLGAIVPKLTLKKFKGYYDSTHTTAYIDENMMINCSPTTFTTDTLLDGVWESNPIAIPLERNDGTGAIVDTIYLKYGEGFYSDNSCATAITSLSDSKYKPSMEGYNFKGYAIDAAGTTMYVDENGVFDSTNMVTTDMRLLFTLKLYVKWEAKKSNFIINYNNKATLATSDTDNAYVLKEKEIYRVAATDVKLGDITSGKISLPLLMYYPTQNVFDGYYDAQTGGTQYVDKDGNIKNNALFSFTGTLYAHWEPIVYEISVARNDGSVNLVTTVYDKFGVGIYNDKNLTTPTTVIATPSSWAGHEFKGYVSNSDGSGAVYADENGVVNTANFNATAFYSNKTIFAKWEEKIFTVSLRSSTGLLVDTIYILGGKRASLFFEKGKSDVVISSIDMTKLPDPPTEDEKFGGFTVSTSTGEVYIVNEKGEILDTIYLFANGDNPATPILSGASPSSGMSPIMPLFGASPITPSMMTAQIKWVAKTTPVVPPTPFVPSSGDGSTGGGGGGGGGGNSGVKTNTGSSLYGWQKIGNKWYYYLATGITYKGWLCENATDFYYLDPEDDGAMATGYKLIDGYLYYFKDVGLMTKNELINDVYIDNTGAIVQVEKYCKAEKAEYDETLNKFYLLDKDNKVITDSVVTYKGYIYVASPFKYPNGISELMCGNCNVGDIVLYFDGMNGGYLNNIFKRSNNTLMSYTIKGIANNLVK